MSIEGHVQVAVDFNDADTASACDTLKKIRLASNSTYSTNKVAIVTGTCGTAAVTFAWTSPGYVGADGQAVEFSTENTIDGIAFVAEPYGILSLQTPSACPVTPEGKSFKIASEDGRVAMTQLGRKTGNTLGGLTINVFVDTSRTQETASYAFVMWGH